MNDDDLIRLLHTAEDTLTREQADAILARGPAIAPRLAAIVSSRKAWRAEDASFWAPIHATFLLGALGGPDAVKPLLDALRHACAEDVDWVTETMPDILGHVGAPAVDALHGLAADGAADRFARQTACEALREIAFRHPDQKERIAGILRPLAATPSVEKTVRWSAGHFLLHLARPEDRPLLESLAGEQERARVAEYFDRKYVREVYDGPPPFRPCPDDLDWMEFYEPDAIEERQRALEQEALDTTAGDDDEDPLEVEYDDDDEPDPDGPPPPPIVSGGVSPGRNDPCPCGSGKKHKKCCGR